MARMDSLAVSSDGLSSGAVPAIVLEDLTVRYGSGPAVLQGVNCVFGSGSFHFVEGASGAGKSTLLRVLRMELFAESGRVVLFGRDLARCSRSERVLLRRRLGLVFQDFRLVPWLSALENVALPLRILGESEREARAKAGELLEWAGLSDRGRARPDTLSGGQRQCVAIARAVIGRPDFLLADEPTGSVDESVSERLLFLLSELQRGGMGILFATHDGGLVRRLGHRRLCLEEGRAILREGFGRAASAADGSGASDSPSEAPHRVSAASGRSGTW